MIILKVLYYLFPLAFIFVNFLKLGSTKKYIEFGKSLTDNAKKNKEDQDKELLTQSCLFATYAITSMMWGISLFFTYNYEFALIMMPFTYIMGKMFYNKESGATIGNIIYMKFAILIAICYYAFLIINTFHLHIQLGLFDYLKSLF